MIVHRKELIIDEVELLEPSSPHHDHIVWARLSIRNANPIYIGSYYRSNSCNNNGTITGLKDSLQHINTLTKNNPRATVVLGGDFNARGIDWDNSTVKPGAEHKPLCEIILETLSEHSLEQLQKSPTRKDSLLDLFCTNKPGLVKSICNIPGFSSEDHEFLVIDSWIKPELLRKAPRKFFKWSKADWPSMKADTEIWAGEWLRTNTTRSTQENYTSFCTHIQATMSKYVPH